ncbi:immune inhibitor A domain-containing protein [Humibacillus xanthopallidus]|uniref:Immune inhibitor A n=1 Tax=Humibacillus xanthopallidus TaxID=412689 RepID=A0A543I0Y1_9MICO|nr:immune inhibitor A domain-containing protein [Humibacillus xanthopallidus]TQM64201.1 immune inhibitor A [Humibacillus xanthopallidus]
MRKSVLAIPAGALAIALTLGLNTTAASAVSGAAPPGGGDPQVQQGRDSLEHPLGTKQAALRAKGVQLKLSGKLAPDTKVAKIAKGQYVELAREGEDTIWTVLGEFGTTVSPTYGGTAGPVHNQIPEPDRAVDNSTIWTADFSPTYFSNLLFSDAPGAVSMRNFYKEQSSNRYTVNGDVTDWVSVPFNEANYGSNYCGSIVCSRTWLFVRDSVNAWYNAQLAAGKSEDEINAALTKYDVWDRYDYNGNGNFNEPDGYIDHFQSVHAGEGEETGGGAQGTDAIWSHRWYAFYNNIGFTGPAQNKLGGIRVGNSNLWIGDYTVEPENGGVGVFAHEFGHDLGLPDLYDTSGNTGGAENSTGFWTLYSSGSYGSSGKPADGIGTKPIPMSAYEKIFLGWSNYLFMGHGQSAAVKLGPASATTKQAQQLVVVLPDKKLTATIGDPYAGSNFYHSGSGNDLDNTMTRQVTLPAGTVALAAKVRYSIETDWDYAYLTVNGSPVATNLSTATNPNGQNFGNGITGSSSNTWVDLAADLSAYAGQTVTLGFRYWTDGAVADTGFGVDDIDITGQPLDGAESDPGWTFDGFSSTTGTVTQSFFNAYFAEYRNYRGYDAGLKTGPYNFGFLDDPNQQNWVEHFPYQDGLLVWYYDTSFADNNIGDNCLAGRCGGLYLPVDAHPALLVRPDNGKVWRPRIQSYDSTFGLEKTDPICLHANSVKQCYASLPATPVFDDSKSYWVAPNPATGNFGWSSVQVPNTGTKIRVVGTSAQGDFMQVTVNK